MMGSAILMWLERVFETVLRASWQGGVLALFVLALTVALGQRLGPRWRFLLWLVVIARLALPWVPATRWSVYSIAVSSRAPSSNSPALTPDIDSRGANDVHLSPLETRTARLDAPMPSLTALDNHGSEHSGTGIARQSDASTIRLANVTLVQGMTFAWLAGVAILVARLGRVIHRLHRSRARWKPADSSLSRLLEQVCAALRVRRPVALYIAEVRVGPAACGVWNSSIVIPAHLAEALSVEEMRLVLLHEVVHIRRHDPLVDLVATFVATVHWFNPLSWLALMALRREREFACDAAILDHLQEDARREYGTVLLRAVELLQGPQKMAGVVAMFGGRFANDPLAERIGRIASYRRATTAGRVGGLFVLVILTGLGLTDAAAPPAENAAPDKTAPEAASRDTNASGAPNTNEVAKVDLYGDSLPAGATARLGSVRFRTMWGTRGMGFAQDDRTLVTAESDRIVFWDITTGRRTREIPVTAHGIVDLLPMTDGREAVTIGMETDPTSRIPKPSLCLWDLASGELRAHHEQTDNPGNSKFVLMPDGRHFVVASSPGVRVNVVVRELPTGREVKRIQVGQFDQVGAVAVSPDGETVAVSSASDLYFWEWRTDRKPAYADAGRHLVAMAFSPDGTLLAEGPDSRPDIRIRDVRTREIVQTLSLPEKRYMLINSLAFSPDGKRLTTSNSILLSNHEFPHRIQVWSVATGAIVQQFGPNSGKLVVSRDGQWLAAAGIPIGAWDLNTGKATAAGEIGHQELVNSIRFDPSGKRLITSGDDGTARVWDSQTGAEQYVISHGRRMVRAVAVSPDGQWIASSALDDTVLLTDAMTGREVHRLRGHGNVGGRRAVVFTPDNRQLLSFGDDWRLSVWDVATGNAVRELKLVAPELMGEKGQNSNELHDSFYHLMCEFSAAANRLFVSYEHSKGRSMGIFDARTGEIVASTSLGHSELRYAAWSPDEMQIAGTSDDQPELIQLPEGRDFQTPGKSFCVVLRDALSGKERQRISLPRTWAGPVAWSPDGGRIAVVNGSPDRQLNVIELPSGKTAYTVRGLQAVSFCLAFSPDGRRIASGFSDGTALIWDTGGTRP